MPGGAPLALAPLLVLIEIISYIMTAFVLGVRLAGNIIAGHLLFAILSIALLMAVLFRSIKIIVVSMIPNIIPLLLTAGIMGYFSIPLKPSTLLVFGIALGITVDNAILFLAKYRQELKANQHDMNYAIIKSLRETGLGIFYTSVILFFGFIMFVFSQFGGTKALGLLVSITILVGMVTNLIVLPSLLLTLQKRVMSKSFEEPFFEIFDEEEDYDTEKLQIETYNGKTDTAAVRWVNDCEFILQKLHPKNMKEQKAISMKILFTEKNSYTFEYAFVGSNNKQRGIGTKLE